MLFNSLEFLIFLPSVFALYWLGLKNTSWQNCLLFVASFIFYVWWDWRFVGLLLLTIVTTYYAGIFISCDNYLNISWIKPGRGGVIFATLLINLGILLYFKYCNFFIESFVDLLGLLGIRTSVSTLKIILPIGISFYTFTALSYVFDVYYKKRESTNDFLAYASYVSFFPALFCGPIGSSTKQLPQYLGIRTFNYAQATAGLRMFLWGLFLKLCVADRLGIYVDAVYSNVEQHSGTTLLLAAILYSLQIYADFAGYSAMAIGVGKLFGIELQTNFIRPYFAKTVTEFWKRWHISLTSWFRDYIYFPLGGNRVKKLRWIFNILVVFLVSGFWHGAAYTFIIWGVMHGILQIIEKEVLGGKLKQINDKFSVTNLIRIALTFTLVTLAWVFFRASSLNEAITILSKIFTTSGGVFVDNKTLGYGFICTFIMFVVDLRDEYFNGKIQLLNSSKTIVRWFTYLILATIVMLLGVVDGGSFIYFQF